MNFPSSKPLSETELDYLNEALLKSDNHDAILEVSELDGFLTAIVSGPNPIPPSRWLPELWGGSDVKAGWLDEQEMQQCLSLVMQHMNAIIASLMHDPEHYVPLFNTSAQSEDSVLIAEEWCFGYMRGVDLGGWTDLPDEMNTWLYTIALHGRAENFEVLETLSLREHQETVLQIPAAVCALHAYFLAQRTPPMPDRPANVRTGPKVGRNDLCPCGSGKKFKRCCLH